MRSNPIGKAFRAVWNMKKTLPLTVRLMKDARVNRLNKFVFLFATAGYLVFPYDFIFDFPIFGQFDDLAFLLFMLTWFIKRAPEHVLEEYGWKETMLPKQCRKKDDKDEDKDKKDEKRTGRLSGLIGR